MQSQILQPDEVTEASAIELVDMMSFQLDPITMLALYVRLDEDPPPGPLLPALEAYIKVLAPEMFSMDIPQDPTEDEDPADDIGAEEDPMEILSSVAEEGEMAVLAYADDGDVISDYEEADRLDDTDVISRQPLDGDPHDDELDEEGTIEVTFPEQTDTSPQGGNPIQGFSPAEIVDDDIELD